MAGVNILCVSSAVLIDMKYSDFFFFSGFQTWETPAIWMPFYSPCFQFSLLLMICSNRVSHGKKFHSMHLSGKSHFLWQLFSPSLLRNWFGNTEASFRGSFACVDNKRNPRALYILELYFWNRKSVLKTYTTELQAFFYCISGSRVKCFRRKCEKLQNKLDAVTFLLKTLPGRV